MERKFTYQTVTKKSYVAFIPAVVVAAGIAVLSLWENPQLPPSAPSDKVLHAFAYVVLAMTLMGGWVYSRRTTILYYLMTILGVTLYGGLMELLQHWCTRTRTGDWLDLLADFIGALIGILLIAFFHSLRRPPCRLE